MRLGNLLKMGFGIMRARALNRRAPLNVMLSVTNRCASSCAYCSIPSRQQKELTTEQVFALIDQSVRMGAGRLGLWGGEPLLRDDIGLIIDHAKARGLFVTMDSNGHFLDGKLPLLKNLDHFILALDGPQEMHDRHRGPGSFQKTMRAAALLKGRIPTWTITVLTKHNLEGVDFILETAGRHGFLATFQVLHHNDILGRGMDSLAPSGNAYREAIGTLIRKKKAGAPVASSFAYLEHLLRWPDYAKPMLPDPIDGLRCRAGQLFCNVDTDGAVYPCSLLVGKTKALNFLDAGFKKAFDRARREPCRACNASCYTEYNYLYSLRLGTVMEWIRAMHKTRRHSHAVR